MSKRTVQIEIDHKPFKVKKRTTILEAAQKNNIYIPTLCYHKDLAPYGGCRMCLVEVEGMRGFPTACTTPVEEGMVVRTHTKQLNDERSEILRLLLSEHTASCLICDENDACREAMGTIRKAGVTTGCRYCPKDGQCELQDVVKYLDLKDINYPIYYRNMIVEKEDPFYDRDYNLCILCGRCIRVCHEVRAANTLAFKERGRHTVIGPAYTRTHLEAGCEFCGACVEVCPTGTLSEKARKWDGPADSEVETTCAFCGIGCQLQLQVKHNAVIGSLPADDPLINNGQLCVKGRFCVNEMVNHHQRLKVPYKFQDGTNVDILWEEAIEIAADRISRCKPDQFAMLVSANCSNEDLYIAQKFTRQVVKSDNIDTMTRHYYGRGFNAYVKLFDKSVPLLNLQNASHIVCVGLDARFGRSVAGVALRKAMQRGAKVISVYPREHHLSVLADVWLHPLPGQERALLEALFNTGDVSDALRKVVENADKEQRQAIITAAKMLSETKNMVILVGSAYMQHKDSVKIYQAIERLAEQTDAGIMPLPAQNNLAGSLLMGVYPELQFGAVPHKNPESIRWNSEKLFSGSKSKVLYMIGENPLRIRPSCDFLIYQNIYPPGEDYQADLILPAAAFTESDGTFINGEGRVQRVRQAVNAPGKALPDWKILCNIARKLNMSGFEYPDVAEIHREIGATIEGFDHIEKLSRAPVPIRIENAFKTVLRKSKKADKDKKKFPLMLCTSINENSYRGYPLSNWVDGARTIFARERLDINPSDASDYGIKENDAVQVDAASFHETWTAHLASEIPRGILHVTLPAESLHVANPYPVRISKI